MLKPGETYKTSTVHHFMTDHLMMNITADHSFELDGVLVQGFSSAT